MTLPKTILIAGPTASGKSALALALAGQLGGVVINADSMQVYAGLNILTARPAAADLARAPHRLYGHVPTSEAYSVGRWLADAARELAAAHELGLVPIIVGGTGLYFHAALHGLTPVPDIALPVRTHWRAEAERLGPEALHAVLASRDPVMAGRLRPSDPQRVTRALEVLHGTGRSLAEWARDTGRPLLEEASVVRAVLLPEREALYHRCNRRFDLMLEAGALTEVDALLALGLATEKPAMRALGVRPLAAHLRGELTLAAAAEQAKAETRHYAKRQTTWIRGRMADWPQLDAGDAPAAALLMLSRLRAAER